MSDSVQLHSQTVQVHEICHHVCPVENTSSDHVSSLQHMLGKTPVTFCSWHHPLAQQSIESDQSASMLSHQHYVHLSATSAVPRCAVDSLVWRTVQHILQQPHFINIYLDWLKMCTFYLFASNVFEANESWKNSIGQKNGL